MADPRSSSGDGDDAAAERPGGAPPGMPRWVKVFAVIALVLAVLLVGLVALSDGDHGPGRHAGVSEAHEPIEQPVAPAGGLRPTGR